MDANNLKCLLFNCVYSCVKYYYVGRECKDNSDLYLRYIFTLESGCENASDKLKPISDVVTLPSTGTTLTCVPGISDLNPIATCTGSSNITEIQ